ncbi:MAG TPA: PAS domain S-box protein [Verrucomicrobiae bacterium]|nr:PAS domain S-box protein [Verrucomicrobiae bacterium]
MPDNRKNFAATAVWAKYGVAVLAVFLGWILRESLSPSLGGQRLAFIFFFPAIAITAWYGGLAPAVLATGLSAVIANWYLLGHGGVLGSFSKDDVFGWAGFFLSSGIIIGAIELMHRAQKRLVLEASQRGRAEAELQREKELLFTTLQSIRDAVIATDTEGQISFMNAEAERLTGWGSTEANGRALPEVFQIVHAETRQPLENPVDKALRTGAIVGPANHAQLISKSGSGILVDDNAAPIRKADGTISGVVLVFRDVTEKQAAQRNSARLAAIVEFSGDAILTKTLNSVVQSWNAAAERLFGYRPEEIIGRPVTVLFPPDRLGEEDQILERLRQGKPVERLETIRVSKHGRQIPVAVSISPIKDAEGRVIGASKILQDITPLVAVREALVQEKELLATTLASIGDAVLVTDAQARVRFLNKEAERLTGWASSEAEGKPIGEVFHIINEQTRERIEDPAAKVLRLGGVVGLANHTILVSRDGGETPIDDSAAPIRREGGPINGIVVVFRDFSERKKLEQQQQRMYDLLQAVNEARKLPDIYEAALETITQCLGSQRSSILLIDKEGVMRFTAWRCLSDGYRAAVEGHSPWKADDPDTHPVCIEDARKIEGDLKPVIQREGIGALAFVPIRYGGKLLGKFMVYYNQEHHFRPEELRLAVAIANQVGLAIQRLRAQEQLETIVKERTAKLSEMIAELQHVSYAITHDMRAPLRAMSTFAGIIHEGLSADPNTSPELLDSCRRIISSATRLDQLIKDALNYTKAVLQELPLHPVDLARLIPGLIESYPNLQSDKAEIIIPNDLPVVLGEESLLTQCFSNLLGNAVKFVAPGVRPRVRLRVERADEIARIFVEDNGIGITKESQRRLFGMFERLTSGYEGTGIGLAIVRKVVERMGGRVGVESDLGKGSQFWVELKVVRPAPAQPPR